MLIPPLSDRAAGALLAALRGLPDEAGVVLDRLPGLASEARAALAALGALSEEDRAAWLDETLRRCSAIPTLSSPHLHSTWIDAALAGRPGGREALATGGDPRLLRQLLGRLPSPGPLPPPLAGLQPPELHGLVLALGARRAARALLPAGPAALAAGAIRFGPIGARLVTVAAQGAEEELDSVRSAIAALRPALVDRRPLERLGVVQLARLIAGRPAAVERAIVALPRDLGESVRQEILALSSPPLADGVVEREIAGAVLILRRVKIPAGGERS